jgi:hypothetical protein
MKSMHFLVIAMAGGGLSLAAVAGTGCGGGSTSTGTGGATTKTTTTTKTSSSSVATGTGGGAGGGAGGGMPAPTPNVSQALAQTLTVNGMAFAGEMADATTTDWYTFMGTAGERVYIAANAVSIITPAPADTENNIIDTVVTLFDSTGKKILAEDDDAYPRSNTDSQLFSDLPTTGQYFYTVQSCASAFSAAACGTEAPTIFAYETFVADVGKLNGTTEGSLTYSISEVYAGKAQTGLTANAVPIPYTVTKNAVGVAAVDGDGFTATANTHVFSFTVPAGLTPTTGSRLRTDFWLQPIGINNGDGSTGNVKTWITAADGTTIIGQANEVNYKDGDDFTDGPLDLSVPVTSGSQYFLFVQDFVTPPSATDSYFFLHTLGDGNPLQVAGGGNISAATAQVLKTTTTQPGSYFVDGDITAVGTQYWYEVDPPTGAKTVSTTCSSARSGSGVMGLTIDLQAQVGATGTPTSIVGPTMNKVETASGDLAIPVQTAAAGLTLPTGATKMFLIVSATGQSTTVTGTSYECAVNYGM